MTPAPSIYYDALRGWVVVVNGTEHGPYWTRAAAESALRNIINNGGGY